MPSGNLFGIGLSEQQWIAATTRCHRENLPGITMTMGPLCLGGEWWLEFLPCVFLAQTKLDSEPLIKVRSFPRPARPGVNDKPHFSCQSSSSKTEWHYTNIVNITLTMSTFQELPDTRGLRLPHRAQRHEQRLRVIQPLRDHGQPGRIRCLQTQVRHWSRKVIY